MSFFRSIFHRTRDTAKGGNALSDRLGSLGVRPAADQPAAADQFSAEQLQTEAEAIAPRRVTPALRATPQAAAPQPAPGGIWDLDDDLPSAEELLARAVPAAEEAPEVGTPAPGGAAAARKRRTKTRLIGFDTSAGESVDVFRDSPVADPTRRAQFPVGWILIVEGPGRGECFALTAGMSQIGRDDDQAIQLDFGDAAISRSNHAAIVYDPKARSFLLGHGGKSNIVRLNGTPVISNEALNDGDTVNIGETVLRLRTMCGPDFDWSDAATATDNDGENDDVAIA